MNRYEHKVYLYQGMDMGLVKIVFEANLSLSGNMKTTSIHRYSPPTYGFLSRSLA
jgi:hypothetical protein